MIADFQRHITQSHTGYVVKTSETDNTRNQGGSHPSEPSPPSQGLIQRPFNLSEFSTYIDVASRQYEAKYQSLILPFIANHTQEDLLIVRYEDLQNYTTRTQVLQTVVNFLRLPNVDPSRLHCAFALAKTYRRPTWDKITAPWAYPHLDKDPSSIVKNTVVDQRLHAHIEFTQRQQQQRRRHVVTL